MPSPPASSWASISEFIGLSVRDVPTRLIAGVLRDRFVSTKTSAVSADRTRRLAFIERLITWGFNGELRRTGEDRKARDDVLWGVSGGRYRDREGLESSAGK